MLVDYYFPIALSPDRLDKYLASGWFRNSQMLFRTKILCLEGSFFSVVNVRLPLKEHYFTKSQHKLKRRNDKQFTVEINRAKVDAQREKLYQLHKSRFQGFLYLSLYDFLQGDTPFSLDLFDTYEVAVFDDKKLIALSYFDFGNKSIASLIGLYHPDYDKYSLGIYTMLKEIEFGKSQEKKYYYPGYILKDSSLFDYKLRLGVMQYYDWNNRWISRERFMEKELAADLIKEKMNELEKLLVKSDITFQKILYPSFSIAYMNHVIGDYVKSPVFFKLNNNVQNVQNIIEYWIEEDIFVISQTMVYSSIEQFDTMNVTKEYMNKEVYCLDLLCYANTFFRHQDPKTIINFLLLHFRSAYS